MKSRSRQIAAKAGGLAGGFLIMVAVGWNLKGGLSGPAAENSASPTPRSSRERQPRPPGPRDVAAARMAEIRNAGTPAERLRTTIAFANTLPVSEFGKWLTGGWFTLREGPEFTLFTQILRERWLRENPEGFILWSIKNDSDGTPSLMAAWADDEPQKFLDFFKRHPTGKNDELEALAVFARNHPELALQRLLELDGESPSDNVDYHANDLFQALAEKSPVAFEAALESLKEPLRSQAERILVARQVETDFSVGLRKLFSRHDGFEIYYNACRGSGVGRIVDYLAELPPGWRNRIIGYADYVITPDTAEKWWSADLAGAGFSEGQINSLQTVALQQMAVRNPEAAFKLMAGFDFPPQEGDGDGSRRRGMIIARALAGNPEKTDEIIAGLTTEKEKEMARKYLVRIAEENERRDARKVETPEQWLENASRTDFKASYEYRGMLRGWDHGRLGTLGEKFQSLPDEQKQQVAKIISGNVEDYYSTPPALVGDSIRYLLSHPPANLPENPEPQDIPGFSNASQYAALLAVKEPETATAWVDTLPEGTAKLWARRNILVGWSEYDPAAAEQWLKTLPAATQAEIRQLGKQLVK